MKISILDDYFDTLRTSDNFKNGQAIVEGQLAQSDDPCSIILSWEKPTLTQCHIVVN